MANIYEKLQAMRVALQNMNIKKSGENKFAGYKYYELGDFMPPINQLMEQYKVCGIVTYGKEEAVLTLYNAEKPDESVSFTSPMADAVLKGAHPIQNLGAVETYQRRYLYMTAFEIVEADALDATQGRDSGGNSQGHTQSTGRTKPAQKPASRPTAQKPQGSNLPPDLSDQLNNAIKSAKQILGVSVQKVVEMLEQETGIKMQDVTVETAPVIFEGIDKIIGAELPF